NRDLERTWYADPLERRTTRIQRRRRAVEKQVRDMRVEPRFHDQDAGFHVSALPRIGWVPTMLRPYPSSATTFFSGVSVRRIMSLTPRSRRICAPTPNSLTRRRSI